MPIRFRCQYCNQLLGIARRKAGTKVDCPTCHAQVLVPQFDSSGEVPSAGVPEPAPLHEPPPVFERSDFDDFLHPPSAAAPPVAPAAPAVPGLPAAFDVERLDPAALSGSTLARPPAGVFLTPTQATVLTVSAVFLLAIAFAAGLLVGRYCF
jgi:phage FluMu protein Com